MEEINFKEITKPYEAELIESLRDFIKINSQYDESTVSKTNPFGIGVTNALKYFYNIAKKDGFKVANYDNIVVEVLLGEGDKNITIMAHADVVPEGTGWDHDPFDMQIINGVAIGRGVADDKGPLLSAYYALKSIKDNGLIGNYQIRFLVGGNEETGSKCMEHYFHKLRKKMPTYGFSPDSNFPIVFAEKAIFNFTVKRKFAVPGLISIEGGTAPNSVIERCLVRLELNDDIIPFITENYPNAEVETKDDVVNVVFIGIAAHGSTPQLGVNAAIMALEFLFDYTKDENFEQLIRCFKDVYGAGVHADVSSFEMGRNSLNVGLIHYENNELELVCNYRYGDTTNEADIKNNIKNMCSPFRVAFTPTSPLLFFKKDSPLISSLWNSYKIETGDYTSKPIAMGGGTYAKETSNTVAFGLEMPGWNSNMHGLNEKIEVKTLYLGMAIYARSILALGKLIDENKI